MTDESTGETHGFVARRQLDGTGSVVFQQFLIEQHSSGGGEVLTSLDQEFKATLSEEMGSKATPLTPEGYSFELLSLENKSAEVPTKPLLFPQAIPQRSICCISCSGTTVCGCSVSACGSSCCAGSCCGGSSGPNEENKNP